MSEFSQNCLDCLTNSLSNLNDANSDSNLRCGNSAHNVSNEGILSFFKNIDNSSYNASDLELLAAFLVGRFGSGGIGIKLFGMFSNTDERPTSWPRLSFFLQNWKTWWKMFDTNNSIWATWYIVPWNGFYPMAFVVLLDLMVVGTRLLFPFLTNNWIYNQLYNTF